MNKEDERRENVHVSSLLEVQEFDLDREVCLSSFAYTVTIKFDEFERNTT